MLKCKKLIVLIRTEYAAPVTVGYKQVFQDCLRQELTVETVSNYHLRATATSHIHACSGLPIACQAYLNLDIWTG